MKTPILVSIMASASLALAKTVSVNVVDENSQPVSNALVRIWFFEQYGAKTRGHDLETGVGGNASAEGYIAGGFGVRVK